MNLPTCPHLTQSPFRSTSSPQPTSTPYSSSLSPPLPSSLLSKDSLHTSRTSPVSSWSSSSIMLPLPNSSTSEHAQMISLLCLACPFTPPSYYCQDQSSTSLSPTPSTTTWRSSPPASFTQPSPKSSSPSPKLNNENTWNRSDTLLHPQPPYPWPFTSHPCLLLLPPIQ